MELHKELTKEVSSSPSMTDFAQSVYYPSVAYGFRQDR